MHLEKTFLWRHFDFISEQWYSLFFGLQPLSCRKGKWPYWRLLKAGMQLGLLHWLQGASLSYTEKQCLPDENTFYTPSSWATHKENGHHTFKPKETRETPLIITVLQDRSLAIHSAICPKELPAFPALTASGLIAAPLRSQLTHLFCLCQAFLMTLTVSSVACLVP